MIRSKLTTSTMPLIDRLRELDQETLGMNGNENR